MKNGKIEQRSVKRNADQLNVRLTTDLSGVIFVGLKQLGQADLLSRIRFLGGGGSPAQSSPDEPGTASEPTPEPEPDWVPPPVSDTFPDDVYVPPGGGNG